MLVSYNDLQVLISYYRGTAITSQLQSQVIPVTVAWKRNGLRRGNFVWVVVHIIKFLILFLKTHYNRGETRGETINQFFQIRDQQSTKSPTMDRLLNTDIWIGCIFPFIGKGSNLNISLVCWNLNQAYGRYCDYSYCTLYSVLFSSVTMAYFGLGSLDINNWYLYSKAARAGNLDVVQSIHMVVDEDDWDWNAIYLEAAAGGSVPVLRWLQQQDHLMYWPSDACARAAGGGHLEALQYLHEHSSAGWWSNTCEAAAKNGHLNCLIYAHEKDCRWCVTTCRQAAWYGHIECLRYARKNGAPWNNRIKAVAAEKGYTDEYSNENVENA